MVDSHSLEIHRLTGWLVTPGHPAKSYASRVLPFVALCSRSACHSGGSRKRGPSQAVSGKFGANFRAYVNFESNLGLCAIEATCHTVAKGPSRNGAKPKARGRFVQIRAIAYKTNAKQPILGVNGLFRQPAKSSSTFTRSYTSRAVKKPCLFSGTKTVFAQT